MTDTLSKKQVQEHAALMLGISDAAEAIGMRTMGVKLSFDKLEKEV